MAARWMAARRMAARRMAARRMAARWMAARLLVAPPLAALLVAALLLVAPRPGEPGTREAAAAPLTTAQKRAFRVSAREQLKPIEGQRYLRSNETELQLYGPYIKGLGGGYVGVGADQNYTLMAMARSRYVWLMDYDPFVTRLHWIYRALILESPTADDFIKTWNQPAQMKALLHKHYGGTERLPYLEFLYKRYRKFLKPYHRWTRKRRRGGQGTTWLSNATYYRRVRTMWQEGRIQALSGDLHGKKVFSGICAAARRLKASIRIVYLSNAEMYLPYSSGFMANMNRVPWDEKTLLVRTVRHNKYPMRTDRWHYNIQPFGKDFLQRLKSKNYRRVYHMMRDLRYAPAAVKAKVMRPKGFSRFTDEVPTFEELRKRWLRRHRRRPRPRAR